jgi:hypothetical protein
MQGEYADYGDVVTFDTTHKTNIYDKPLGMFVGANSHLQCTVFGFVLLGDETVLSAFQPRGVPGPTSKLSLRAPAQMGRRETEHKEGKTAASCCPAPRVDALAVGGYKRSRGRESLFVSPSSRAATSSYEGPGPSFYRCKERVQVYNGGCSNMPTCPAERSQSPMYMPTWLSKRC